MKIDSETGENITGALFGLFSITETEFTEETAILTSESNEEESSLLKMFHTRIHCQ